MSAPSGVLAALTSTPTTIRLSLHVLAATIWIGGQFTLAGLLPTLRSLGPEATRRAARAFSRLAWPAYAALVATGLWNIAADHPTSKSSSWHVALGVKIGVVALAGLATLAHQTSKKKAVIAIGGAVASLASVAALVLGVLLAG
jgi:putative copper export protein